ncbi:BLUF domain-containing protein [Thalassotalea euphylliae]|nr:BLUF domain-containing protein [Thalassotalea euphylliae]
MHLRLVYFSRSTSLMAQNELVSLLKKARMFNDQNDITGLLLYKNQSFVQLLEGPSERVASLFQSICTDERHYAIKTLVKEEAEQRLFPDWSMGFQNLNQSSEAEPLAGYSLFMSDEHSPNLPPNYDKTMELLLFFRARS